MRSYSQIVAILRNRLGEDAARLLAEPSLDDASGQIVWADAAGADLRPIGALPLALQAQARADQAALVARIEALADRMADEGDAGQVAAFQLRCALTVPDGQDWLYVADGRPVLVNWGHAVEGQAVPPSPTVAKPLSAAAPASPPVVETAEKPVVARSGVLWLAPLLLLAVFGYLLWLLMQPLDPVIVENELPPLPAQDPRPEMLARLASLKAELARAQGIYEDLGNVCRLIPVEEPEPEPEPKPEPRVVAVEPEPEPEPAPEPAPEPDPVPRAPQPRTPSVLPAEVPRVSDLPPELTQVPTRPVKQPTLCEPGWSPTERPEVIVAIDGSGSMRDSFPGASSRIDAARTAIGAVVQNLHKDIKTGLVSFTSCDETSTPRKYSYAERPELLARVRGLSPTAGTSLANSIRRGGNAAKSVGPATVVVVSDGEDTCGGDPCGAARALKARKPMLTVNVIDLSGSRSAVLQCVANVTGGRVFTPRNAQQMAQEVQQATGQPDAGRCNP